MKDNIQKIALFGRTDNGTPMVSETIGRDEWINFGAKNDFPQELLRLLQNADPLHAAIVQKKVDMVASLGWDILPGLEDFLANDLVREDLHTIAKDVAFNAVVFGGYYLNIVWDADGQRIAKIKSVPFEKVRIAKPKHDECEGFYISRDWLSKGKAENKPTYITSFDGRVTIDSLNKRSLMPSQLLFVRLNSMGLDWYSLPFYNAVLTQLKLSAEVWNYQLKSAQRGYQPNLIVSIPSTPPPAQREQIAKDFKDRAGTDTGGDTVVLFGEEGKIPTFEILNPSNNDQKYKDLIGQINEEIFVGHMANATVAGIQTSGKLGTANEIIEAHQMFQVEVIAPLQRSIEGTFNKFTKINALPEMKLKNYFQYLKENINPPQPTSTVMHHIRRD